jgi:hypothetical protein
MEARLAGHRLLGLRGAAAGLLTLAVLTAGSTTATAADPAYTETETEMVIPVMVLATSECTGEPVEIKGHLFLRGHITQKDGTHYLTVSEQTNTQGVTAVNPLTGAKYVFSDVDTFTATLQKSTSATSHQTWLFSRNGESWPDPDDFYLYYLIHFSYNAAGTVTADITDVRTGCR